MQVRRILGGAAVVVGAVVVGLMLLRMGPGEGTALAKQPTSLEQIIQARGLTPYNPFTLTVHQKTMMGMEWVPLTNWEISVTPDMPAMGHGSSGNVAPQHVAAGRYDGGVNLTMRGLWRITFNLEDGAGVEVGSVEYEVQI